MDKDSLTDDEILEVVGYFSEEEDKMNTEGDCKKHKCSGGFNCNSGFTCDNAVMCRSGYHCTFN